MATIGLLLIAAAAEAGPVVIAVVASVGSYIDNTYVFAQRSDPQPLDNLQLPGTSEGGPAISLIGTECKVPGQIIYLSQIEGTPTDQTVDVAIAVSNDKSVVDSIVKVYAEGLEIFTGSGVLSHVNMDDVSIGHDYQVIKDAKGKEIEIGGNSGLLSEKFDLSKFRPFIQDSLTMSGWTDNGNNWGSGGGTAGNNKGRVYGIFRLQRSGTLTGKIILKARRRKPLLDPKVKVNEIAAGLVKPSIFQTVTPLNPAMASVIELKDGTAGQTRSTLIQKYEPNSPAFEGTAYFTLEKFRVKQFGSRLPSIFSIIKSSATDVTIGQGIATMFERAGWSSTTSSLRFDTSALENSRIVRGYTMLEEGSLNERLQPLVYAYDLAAQIRDGVVFFFHTKNARVFTIPIEDFGIGGDSDSSDGLSFNPITAASLPSKVTVHFTDPFNLYEDASVERHVTANNIRSEDSMEIDLRSLVLTMEEAIEIAERLLRVAQREQIRWKGHLPAKYWYVLENDVIETTFNGQTIKLTVIKTDRGQDRTHQLEGRVKYPDPPRTTGAF